MRCLLIHSGRPDWRSDTAIITQDHYTEIDRDWTGVITKTEL